MAKTNQIMK